VDNVFGDWVFYGFPKMVVVALGGNRGGFFGREREFKAVFRNTTAYKIK
jgi:hypothetical protein